MVRRHMKRCSVLLSIREIQMNTTVRYQLTLVRMAVIKNSTNKCWRGCGAKGTLQHCFWVCKLVQQLWKTAWRIELPYHPAVPLLGIYPDKTVIQNDTCTPMFIVKTWKQPKCPSTDEWIKKMGHIYAMVYY